ncbi:isopenicillin N synthase family dioxygenase [Ilumatobacter sp.]|jgi:isopenicillin N synthase-like dioxygenase|uniref:isopenicillin N synthase family dioxygenase n=1 Tax=Ilumatobacter sp. TaxID=1967498 RepID=UPI00375134F9
MTQHASGSVEAELAKERTFGGQGINVVRDMRIIDLSDPDVVQGDIDDALWNAAAESGFFQVVGHGIDQGAIDAAFDTSLRFFALPTEVKERRQMPPRSNAGWEFKSQKRPSTGTFDHKETYQVTIPRMVEHDLWPTEEEIDGFRSTLEQFESLNRDLAMRILESFARKLGFDDDFFTQRHDPTSPEYQSTLRILHYLPIAATDRQPGVWRAGAHTDYDCLTLLHQRAGEYGLQVCPGAEAANRDPDAPLGWTDVEPTAGTVTCNIGDMLMRWSDDQLPSTLHRVRLPRADQTDGESLDARYSIAYFAQADRDAMIESPSGRHEPISAADYLQQRIAANFAG